MPELGTYGSVRGVPGNGHPYRDHSHLLQIERDEIALAYDENRLTDEARRRIERELDLEEARINHRHVVASPRNDACRFGLDVISPGACLRSNRSSCLGIGDTKVQWICRTDCGQIKVAVAPPPKPRRRSASRSLNRYCCGLTDR